MLRKGVSVASRAASAKPWRVHQKFSEPYSSGSSAGRGGVKTPLPFADFPIPHETFLSFRKFAKYAMKITVELQKVQAVLFKNCHIGEC